MPRIHRSMLAEGGKPQVGSESKMLGVRVAPHPQADIPVDMSGNVQPRTGGMSVAPEWRKLPWHLIPSRLHARGRGHDDLVCWRLGTGGFKDEKINDELHFRADPGHTVKHGVVEPASVMTVGGFQLALAATCDDWIRDES